MKNQIEEIVGQRLIDGAQHFLIKYQNQSSYDAELINISQLIPNQEQIQKAFYKKIYSLNKTLEGQNYLKKDMSRYKVVKRLQQQSLLKKIFDEELIKIYGKKISEQNDEDIQQDFMDYPEKILQNKRWKQQILFLIKWQKRSDGFQPVNSWITNTDLKQIDPNLMIDFYMNYLKPRNPQSK